MHGTRCPSRTRIARFISSTDVSPMLRTREIKWMRKIKAFYRNEQRGPTQRLLTFIYVLLDAPRLSFRRLPRLNPGLHSSW